MEQMKNLSKMELCNLYGWNVFRHTKDKNAKRKSIVLAVTVGILVLMVVSYVGSLSYSLVMLNAADIIPAYLIAIASLLTIAFGVFKAGGVIFRKKGYDILTSLPLSDWAVVLSRFIRLYVENLLITLLVMLPGLSVYGWFVRPSIGSYLIGVLGVLVIPFIPVAIASGLGVLITGISSRMKQKALVEAILSIGVVVVIMLGSSTVSNNAEGMTQEMLKEMTGIVSEHLEKIYPPAVLLGNAIVKADFVSFIMFAAFSIVVFAVVVSIVSINFHAICRRLYATSAKHDYKMESLKENPVLKAMVAREAKRYFSSGVYVTNTIMGPVMGIVFSVSLLFIDLESAVSSVTFPLNLTAAIPFALAGIFCMNNPVATSISMEGREWWIVKSLPLTTKDILDGKIAFNLCLIAPFYVISEIVAAIALRPDVLEMFWMLVIPLCLIVFSSVFGIAVNLKFPKMDWETEVSIVKQSASAMLGGMGGIIVAILFMFLVMLLPAQYVNYVNLVSCTLIALGAVCCYRNNNRIDFKII